MTELIGRAMEVLGELGYPPLTTHCLIDTRSGMPLSR